MPEKVWLLLEHILNAINELEEFSKGITTLEELLKDKKTLRAIERNLEIIGEASKKLPAEFKEQYTSISWRKISGIRDIIIHNYDGIDYEIVLDILLTKISQLRSVISSALDNR